MPRPRVTYANVAATAALVVALAGGSGVAQALLPQIGAPQSITSEMIKQNELRSGDIRNRSLSGASEMKPESLTGNQIANRSLSGASEMKPESVTGNQIANRSLSGASEMKAESVTGRQIDNGTVTGREVAEGTLNGVDAATVDGKSLQCPAGTRFFVWGCWETTPNGGVNWTGAVIGCSDKGGVLPSAAELAAFAEEPGITITLATAEWTTEITGNPNTNNAESIKLYEPTTFDYAPFSENHPYRCVLPVVR